MTKETFLPMLQEQQSSGLTVVEYCQIQSNSPSTFNYWKRKFGVIKSQSTTSCSTTKADNVTNLVPVQVHKTTTGTRQCSNTGSGVLIQFPNGVQVEFTASNDSVALQMLNTMCSRYV